MKKPFEETITITRRDDGASVADAFIEALKRIGVDAGYTDEGEDSMSVRIAVGPDRSTAMARVLLAVEWAAEGNSDEQVGYACCPECFGIAPNQILVLPIRVRGQEIEIGHHPKCALDAALRKAGVR